MKKLLLLSLISISFLSCKNNEKKDGMDLDDVNASKEIQQQIANAHGLNNFKEVKEVQFTFNVKSNDSLRTSRSWTWKPQTNQVRFTQGDISRTYNRKDEMNEEEKKMDQKFVNDSYWLLFPFQLVWSDANISEEKTGKSPISKKEMNYIEVSYSDDGGYTPGDTYVIYYEDDLLLQEWIYKSADGSREMPTTWEDFEDYKGLKISKSHKSPDGSFELFFTDVKVK